MNPAALRKQAAALDRAAERLIQAIRVGREVNAITERAEREMRSADRMIAAARRMLRR